MDKDGSCGFVLAVSFGRADEKKRPHWGIGSRGEVPFGNRKKWAKV